MAGKKVMYVHGFGSAASSGTVGLLRALLPQAEVVARDIPIHPDEALAMLRRQAEEERPDLIVGTSMGGMYAEQLRGFDRILVNPAFEMGKTMHDHGMMGRQVFQNPRQDGVAEFIVTKALVKEYEAATQLCFQGIDEADRRRVYGLFGDEDPLVHTFDLFRRHYPQAMHFHGAHRLTDHVALHYLVPVIRWIDDRQERRERPIVYIAWEAMVDGWGKPQSSLHKAFELLIEHYQVYIVCPAPTNDHAFIDHAQAWVEQCLSTPAHDRVVFTNQRHLLYGDYLIDPQPAADFMGARIAFGSDEMKTWEDIIVYFSRLGGQ